MTTYHVTAGKTFRVIFAKDVDGVRLFVWVNQQETLGQ